MSLILSIPYIELNIDKDTIYNISIDYADGTLRGVVNDNILHNSEIILLQFSDYGIFFDNRYGNGYDVTKEETELRIKLKMK
jgi:hypothetical protein